MFSIAGVVDLIDKYAGRSSEEVRLQNSVEVLDLFMSCATRKLIANDFDFF